MPVQSILIICAGRIAPHSTVNKAYNIIVPVGVNPGTLIGGGIATDLHIGHGKIGIIEDINAAAVAPGIIADNL